MRNTHYFLVCMWVTMFMFTVFAGFIVIDEIESFSLLIVGLLACSLICGLCSLCIVQNILEWVNDEKKEEKKRVK